MFWTLMISMAINLPNGKLNIVFARSQGQSSVMTCDILLQLRWLIFYAMTAMLWTLTDGTDAQGIEVKNIWDRSRSICRQSWPLFSFQSPDFQAAICIARTFAANICTAARWLQMFNLKLDKHKKKIKLCIS